MFTASYYRKIANAIFVLVLSFALGVVGLASAASLPSPEDAQARLAAGNKRFASGKLTHPRLGMDRREDTSRNGQHPFSTVITCSDSRIPVEIVFDQGIGDVFVIRVAGNVCDVDEVGSIEYGVDHLNTPIMVVLGHSNCGAVTAVVTNAELHGSIPQLVDNIIPAVEKARAKHPQLSGKALVPEAVKANVWQSIDDLLRSSPAVRDRVKDGRVNVVGAVYHLEDGHVEWLGAHPEQNNLLKHSSGTHH